MTPYVVVFGLITAWGWIELKDAKRFDPFVIALIILLTGLVGLAVSILTMIVIIGLAHLHSGK